MLKPSGYIHKNVTCKVFEDPISRERLEGEFIPQVFGSRIELSNYDLECWCGHFYGEDRMVYRSIRVPKETTVR